MHVSTWHAAVCRILLKEVFLSWGEIVFAVECYSMAKVVKKKQNRE